jgi:hypothetical protein
LLLLFPFGEMMSNSATGCRTYDAMMARHVPCYTPDNGTLDATLRLGAVRADQEHETYHGCAERLHLHFHTPRHYDDSILTRYALENTAVRLKLHIRQGNSR